MNMLEPQVIPLLAPADHQAGATDFNSIDMGKLHKVVIVIQFGVVTGNDAVFKLYSGASNATKTTELGFKYRKSGADSTAASADVFGARTAIAAGASGLVLGTAGDWDLRTVTIEFMSDQMTDGHEWLTVETDDGSASALFMSAVGIGWPRYGGDTHLTAVA